MRVRIDTVPSTWMESLIGAEAEVVETKKTTNSTAYLLQLADERLWFMAKYLKRIEQEQEA